MQDGVCAFIIKKINGIYHFLVQAKLECGNFDVMELAPTVQMLTGNMYHPDSTIPEFAEYILNAPKSQILIDALQSEEGGRFYHEQNRNLLIEVGDEFPLSLPERYTWMTLGQMYEFLRFNNYLNIQARSIISALNYK
jgi:oxidase EvaA